MKISTALSILLLLGDISYIFSEEEVEEECDKNDMMKTKSVSIKTSVENQHGDAITPDLKNNSDSIKNLYHWKHYASLQNPTQGYSEKEYQITFGQIEVYGGIQFQQTYISLNNQRFQHFLKKYNPTLWSHKDNLKMSCPMGKLFLIHEEEQENNLNEKSSSSSSSIKTNEIIVENNIEILSESQIHVHIEEYKPIGNIIWKEDSGCLRPYQDFNLNKYYQRPDLSFYDFMSQKSGTHSLNKVQHIGLQSYYHGNGGRGLKEEKIDRYNEDDYSTQILKLGIVNDVMGDLTIYDQHEISFQHPHYERYFLKLNDDTIGECIYEKQIYILPQPKRCGFLGSGLSEMIISNENIKIQYQFLKTIKGFVWNSQVYLRCAPEFGKFEGEVEFSDELEDPKIIKKKR